MATIAQVHGTEAGGTALPDAAFSPEGIADEGSLPGGPYGGRFIPGSAGRTMSKLAGEAGRT